MTEGRCWLCGGARRVLTMPHQSWAHCPRCVRGQRAAEYQASDPTCVARGCGPMRLCDHGDGRARLEHPGGEAVFVLAWELGVDEVSRCYAEWLDYVHLYQEGAFQTLSELTQVDPGADPAAELERFRAPARQARLW